MIVCATGDSHGALDRLYADVLDFEVSLGVRFEWVLHVGDFGAWPDSSRIDGATKRHEGAGDFPAWWAERRPAPRRTVFIKGNHEDFVWLDAQADRQVLPWLFYLRNGTRLDLSDGAASIMVGGLGGCFGPSDYGRQSKHLQSYAKRHYTRDEIDALIAAGPLDILRVHDAPAGVRFERHRRGAGYVSEAAGLDDLLRGTRPRVCFFGHHHSRFDDALDLLLEVSIAHDGAAALEALVVHGEALDGELLDDARSPLAKLDGALGIDLVADGDDGREVVVLGVVGVAVGGSYSKISNN